VRAHESAAQRVERRQKGAESDMATVAKLIGKQNQERDRPYEIDIQHNVDHQEELIKNLDQTRTKAMADGVELARRGLFQLADVTAFNGAFYFTEGERLQLDMAYTANASAEKRVKLNNLFVLKRQSAAWRREHYKAVTALLAPLFAATELSGVNEMILAEFAELAGGGVASTRSGHLKSVFASPSGGHNYYLKVLDAGGQQVAVADAAPVAGELDSLRKKIEKISRDVEKQKARPPPAPKRAPPAPPAPRSRRGGADEATSPPSELETMVRTVVAVIKEGRRQEEGTGF